MKTAPTLQPLLTQTAHEFDIDLSDASVMYRFEDKLGDTITVKRNEDGLLCIGEYKDFGGGKLIGDPEYMLHTEDEAWVPVIFSKPGTGRVFGDVLASRDGKHLKFLDSPLQETIAEGCEAWIRDLAERNGYDGHTSFLIPTWLA
jgi:hypothetical protein